MRFYEYEVWFTINNEHIIYDTFESVDYFNSKDSITYIKMYYDIKPSDVLKIKKVNLLRTMK